jgi:DNA polymerase-1
VENSAVDELIVIAKDIMENASDPVVKLDVKLTVEAGQGANWAEAH